MNSEIRVSKSAGFRSEAGTLAGLARLAHNAGMQSQVLVVDHPLVQHHLGVVRDATTDPWRFRHSMRQLGSLLAMTATANLRLGEQTIETPLESCGIKRLVDRIGLVPILRAGIVMVDPVLALLPEAEVWHLGLYRDEATAKPVPYYNKLPAGSPVDVALILDPMLATGGSACMACQSMVEWGVPETRMLTVIASPEGIEHLTQSYANTSVYTCCIDRQLNDQKFIVPGLGDAGDRVFNTL